MKTSEVRHKATVSARQLVAFLLLILLFPTNALSADTVIVGGNKEYPPYEFLDKQGNPSGYNVELTKAIADVVGLKVKFRLGSWVDIRAMLESGEINVIQGISYTEGRSTTLDFSTPHTIVSHAVYARKGTEPINKIEDLRGSEVAFHNRGFIHDYLTEQNLNATFILTETQATALRLISVGKHDYAVVASLPGTYLINEMRLGNVVPVSKSIASVKYSYAVQKGNEELLAKFNEGLAILKQSGQYQAIYDKWLGVLDPPAPSFFEIAKYWILFIGFLLLILAATLFWSRTLRRQVLIRTAALEQEVQERKRAAEALRQGQQQLIQADKMASLGILVAGMAHEINNPNALILLNTPLVLDYIRDTKPIVDAYAAENRGFMVAGLEYSRISSKLPTKISEIQDCAYKIKRIVDDLKDFARQDDAENVSLFSINTTAQMALRFVENKIQKSTNHFSTIYAPDLPLVSGNLHRIEQVILNLILNACQALRTPEESITLKTSFDRKKKMVVLEVIDQGEGIAAENLPRLMDPFFTTKRKLGGTGLGLSVSSGIVKEHHGVLEYKSKLGKGTTAILKLPVSS
jgi:polar amino acid transport system substrate-binding protein